MIYDTFLKVEKVWLFFLTAKPMSTNAGYLFISLVQFSSLPCSWYRTVMGPFFSPQAANRF